jgi:hypothetical protein
MDTTELLEQLDSCGNKLSTELANPADIAKGVGLALLALSDLIKVASANATPGMPTQPTGFNAKASRW